MISRVIDWCANNRFLVFTGTLLLLLAGIWSLKNIPLDALPDISDVQVIVHVPWEGQPPDIIEDQVTYPIVSTLLAAPHVKAVRAQTMFGDSYIFVVFEDGTDLYWARSRVLEYIQQLQGVLPKDVSPMIGPDATGAGWVYEYAVIDRSHRHSLAELRSLQDWYLRFQLETVPGVAEVASMGGFVRQYQVNLDPNKLRAYNIPLSTVIDRVRDSTNEVGGRVLEMAGARYMIRGLGYLRSLQDLESVPVTTKNGTPVLIRDLGTVAFGPDIREGVVEWNGEGEVVGGIIVMRDGMNALKVIDGVKKKLAEIKPALPAGVEIVSGYDRSGLIHDSIDTLQRDLLLEVAIVSFVTIAFLFHFRSALDSHPGSAHRCCRLFHPHVFPARQLEHHVAGWSGARHRRPYRRQPSSWWKTAIAICRNTSSAPGSGIELSDKERRSILIGGGETGRPGDLLFPADHPRLVLACFPSRSAGRQDVSPAGLDKNTLRGLFLDSCHHARSRSDGHFHPRPSSP